LLSLGVLSFTLLSKTIKLKIHKTITLPVVSCGSKTWSLTLKEERRLSLSESMVMTRIFGPKRDEVPRE